MECRALCSISSCLGAWFPLNGNGALWCKRRDAGLATNYRPISLASCCFKLFQHLVHFRFGPNVMFQGGLRWGDVLVSSFLDVFSSRRSALTFVVFVDIQKAFDTAWVEGTLVRFHDVGVRGQMWHLMCSISGSNWCITLRSMARLWDAVGPVHLSWFAG